MKSVGNSPTSQSQIDAVKANLVSESASEVFDMEESGSEAATPEMDAQLLFIKLKEVDIYF